MFQGMDYDTRLPGPVLRMSRPPVRTPREAVDAYLTVKELGELRNDGQDTAAPGPGRESHPYESEHRIDLTV